VKPKDVIIVVPWFCRTEIFPDERYALRHLSHYLDAFPKCLVVPEGLGLKLEGFGVQRFPGQYFGSTAAHSRLLLSREFYERFCGYEYVLIYQPDVVVFNGGLMQWCQMDYDYLGAPLFRVKGEPKSGFSGACNGGFSLRKVKSFLRVLESRRYLAEKVSFLADVFHRPFVDVHPLPWLKRLQKRVEVARQVRQGADKYVTGYSVNEDHFWSGRASYFYPAFRVAPPEVALQFAFEVAPAWCFERNGRKLPFGAHAWAKYDRGFWEPHLLA